MSRVRLKWWFSAWLAVAAGLVVALSWAPVRQLDALPVILVNVAVALAVFVHFRLGRTDGLTPLLAIGVSLVIAVSIVILVSGEPLGALEALLLGPLTRSTRWSTWITDSITLALLGFAFVVVFRARQISLGADGQLHAGALFGALAAFGFGLPGSVHWLVVLVAAALGGFLLGGLAGVLKSRLGANEVVSTLMLNVIALRVYEAVLSGPLLDRNAGYIQSERFPRGSLLPNLVSHTTITVGLVLVLLAAVALTAYLGSTTSGYRARMVGANAAFARYGGIDERRVVWLSMALSGAIAGLAGGPPRVRRSRAPDPERVDRTRLRGDRRGADGQEPAVGSAVLRTPLRIPPDGRPDSGTRERCLLRLCAGGPGGRAAPDHCRVARTVAGLESWRDHGRPGR